MVKHCNKAWLVRVNLCRFCEIPSIYLINHARTQQSLPPLWAGIKTFSYVEFFISFWIIASSKRKGSSSEVLTFSKIHRKHLCRSLYLNKVPAWRPATLSKHLQHRCFSVAFAKFLRTYVL